MMQSNTSSIKHGIDKILAENFPVVQNTPFTFITSFTNIPNSHVYFMKQNQDFLNQYFVSLQHDCLLGNFNSPRDCNKTEVGDLHKSTLTFSSSSETSEDVTTRIDIESLDFEDCEEDNNQFITQESRFENDSIYNESDDEFEVKRENDLSYKCSSRRLNLVDTKKLTRGNCGENREFYMLQKEKGKPRGRTVKISSGLIIGVEHKKKRAVGRPIKTPRGRNAKVKRDLLTKEGFRLPKLPAIPNPQHSKSYVNYKAVKIDI